MVREHRSSQRWFARCARFISEHEVQECFANSTSIRGVLRAQGIVSARSKDSHALREVGTSLVILIVPTTLAVGRRGGFASLDVSGCDDCGVAAGGGRGVVADG